MIVILEGADGSGKTTLARALVEATGARYVHNSVPTPPDGPLDYWMKRILPFDRPLVIDRLHWSEDVYGNLFRNGSALTKLDRWQLEGWLLLHGAVVVRCQPPLETVLDNVRLNPERLHHDRVESVWHEFSKPWPTFLPVLRYDYTRRPETELINTVVDMSVMMERSCPIYDYEGIGSPRPHVVFVADRHNKCNLGCRSPFVLHSTSGDYLRRALIEAGIWLDEYQVVNGWRLTENGYAVNPSLKFLAASFPQPRYVALGRRAEDALRELGLRHSVTRHPQWWRRFGHGDLGGYARALRSVAGKID